VGRRAHRSWPIIRTVAIVIALSVTAALAWRELTDRGTGSLSGTPGATAVAANPAVGPRFADPSPTGTATTGGVGSSRPSGAASSLPPSPPPGPEGSVHAIAATAVFPSFSHIYVIVMENHEYGSIVGDPRAPYLNGLIRRYGLATNYHAVSHPSEPNYLALFAGSTFGIHDDGIHTLAGRNLADQLDAHRRTWHVYAQDLPSRCYTGAVARGGVDLVGTAGWYARKHEPAISFTDIATNAARCSRITGLAGFSPTAANFELIVPNMTNDMHDGTVVQGDAFLRAFVPRLTGGSAFATSLLVITWDEGSTSLGGGGRVATIVVSPAVRAGFRSAVSHTHDSLLRTVEDAWGLGCLNDSCSANDLREFFGH
jgi:hypothetical protein